MPFSTDKNEVFTTPDQLTKHNEIKSSDIIQYSF